MTGASAGAAAAAPPRCTGPARTRTGARTCSPAAGSRGRAAGPGSSPGACGSGRRASGSSDSSASVYGIFMSREQHARRRLLDDPARVHHRDLVGPAGDHAEVVGDEHHRHEALALLLASRSSTCACTVTSSAVVGSSANRSFGPQASATAMHTRWRMPPESWCGYSLSRAFGLGDADRREQVLGELLGEVLRDVEVLADRLGDLLPDLHHRVQRRHRVLEDHRHLRAPVVAHLLGRRCR